MGNKNIIPFILAIGAIMVALWCIFDTKESTKEADTDAQNLNRDWQNLFGDFSKANQKFKQQYGS